MALYGKSSENSHKCYSFSIQTTTSLARLPVHPLCSRVQRQINSMYACDVTQYNI